MGDDDTILGMDPDATWVTIIIPTTAKYDRYLAEAVGSASSQTVPPGEHVGVVIIPADGMSVGEATNLAAENVSTPYFMRLDCDDILHPHAAYVMSRYMDDHPDVAAVYSDYWETNDNRALGGVISQAGTVPHPGCMMFRRSDFLEVSGFDGGLSRQEGTDLYLRLKQKHPIDHIPLPLWYYRRHGEQMSNAHNEVVQARHEVQARHQEVSTKILVVIPARGGSKGIPRKNLVKLDGVELVAHAIRMAKRSRHPMLVAVSTEDDEIAAVAEREGVAVIPRDPADAADDVSLITVAKHAMLSKSLDFHADIVITIQPTAPRTPVEALDRAIDRLLQDSELDAVVCMSANPGKHPYRLYSRVGERKFSPFFPGSAERYLQRQDRVDAYQFTGGFYARRRRLLEQWDGDGFALGNWEGELVDVARGIDIDTRLDLWLTEAILDHQEDLI